MSKIGAVTLCLNDEDTIAGTINCLKPFVDYHIVLISEKSYFGDVKDNGKSEVILDKLGVDYIKGYWPLDHHQRTLGNKMCKAKGCDWVLTFDSDELMDAENIKKLIEHTKTTEARALVVNPICYWNTVEYILTPQPEYCPVIATKSDVTFPYIRNVDCPVELVDVTMHHVSWAYPKDVYKKVTCYAHATDFNGAEWHDKYYKDWTYPSPAVLPDRVYSVNKCPLPEELVKCYLI